MKPINLMVILFLFNAQLQAQGIKFEQNLSWSEVQAKAKAEKKYIFMDCYTTWCGPCKKMDQEVYGVDSVGRLFNQIFVSMKVQMDKTNLDSKSIRKMYADAEFLSKHYKVEAYPTFLFFNPSGELMHREVGFKSAHNFIQLAKDAVDPNRQYYANIERFKAGELKIQQMGKLAKVAYDNGDKPLARIIAKEYKANYWDKLGESELLKKENAEFIIRFPQLLKSTDLFFQLCLNTPEKIRPLIYQGGASQLVDVVIGQEDIYEKLYKKDKTPVTLQPNWDKIKDEIKIKYADKYEPANILLQYKKFFYTGLKDWKNYTKTINNYILTNQPSTFDNSVSSDKWRLNCAAWDIFENSSEKKLLKNALKWVDISLELDAKNLTPNSQVYDTKANILYKLGRTAEAIQWEEKAINIDIADGKREGADKGFFYDKYMEILEKMKKGEPTWPTDLE